MNRRHFLAAGLAGGALTPLTGSALAADNFEP
jgi:hypothetical protein